MRERLAALVGPAAPAACGCPPSTAMCVRMLRADAERLGFTGQLHHLRRPTTQKRLYKDIMAELDIDPKRSPMNALMNRISSAKNELIGARRLRQSGRQTRWARWPRACTRSCRSACGRPTPSTSTTCCCTRYLLLKNHARRARRPTRSASATSWSTSTRTPTTPSTRSRSLLAAKHQQHHGGGRRRPVHL